MIYFLLNPSDQSVKIGYTKNPRRRMTMLQVGCAAKLKLLLLCEGGNKLEEELHEQFFKHKLHGEWFRYCDDIAAYVVAHQSQHLDLDVLSPPRPVGRPSQGLTHSVFGILDERLFQQLTDYCEEHRLTVSQVIRDALEFYFANTEVEKDTAPKKETK